MSQRRFMQLDVFASGPFSGNPLAVVVDGDGLTGEEMQRITDWTNLSEATFLLPPTDPSADYRVRIFCPGRELAFAGHPTLGSCAAWLAAGGAPRHDHEIVQECGAGLIAIRRDGDRLAFEAPPMIRSGPVDPDLLAQRLDLLGLGADDVVESAWIDNGPGWMGILLESADAVVDVRRPECAGAGFRRGPRRSARPRCRLCDRSAGILRRCHGVRPRGPGHRQPQCIGRPVVDLVGPADDARTWLRRDRCSAGVGVSTSTGPTARSGSVVTPPIVISGTIGVP